VGRRLLVIAGIMVVATLPYLNSLGARFTFDDYGLVIDNPTVPAGTALHRVFALPSSTGEIYRPLTIVSYLLNGTRPFGCHLVNVLLHALTSVAAFVLAHALVGSVSAATMTGLLFAVHPVHTEAVASVAGRGEVLAALFALVAVIAFVQANTAPWRLLSLVAFAAALLSKENALTTIPVLLVVGRFSRRTWTPKSAILSLVPYLVVGALYLVARTAVVGTVTIEPPPMLDNPLAYATVGARLRTALIVLRDYLVVLCVPVRLSADESFNQVAVSLSTLDPRFLVSAGLVAAAVIAVVSMRRRPLTLGALLWATTLSLTANVLFPIGTIKAERLLYLPSFGWCLAVGSLVAEWARGEGRRVALVGAIVAVFAGRTWMRNFDWHDEYTLFTATVASSPESARAQSNAAAVYGQRGDLERALTHYQRAVDIYPQYAEAASGAAHACELMGRHDEARRWQERASGSSDGFTQLSHQAGR
jgi:hypothetical protein